MASAGEDATNGTPPDGIGFDSWLNFDIVAALDRQSISELRAAGQQALIPEVLNAGLFSFELGEGDDTVDYSAEAGLIAAVVSFTSAGAGIPNVLVSHDGDENFAEGFAPDVGDRVDALDGVESLVAAQGESVIDLTGATVGIALRYNADDGPLRTDAELDRDVYRLRLADAASDEPFAPLNLLEYRDAQGSASITQPLAVWNRVEGSDRNDRIELTDRESAAAHAFNLRGGANEVNYNELTRSIVLTVDEISRFDAAAPAASGLIRAHVRPTDGAGHLFSGVDDTIASFHGDNALVPGSSLRIEASQDAEDLVAFADDAQSKLFVLGRVVQGSREIGVRFVADPGAAVHLTLTGFEQLRDAPTDDVFLIEDLNDFLDNLALIDTAASDADTLALSDGALQDYVASTPDVLWPTARSNSRTSRPRSTT